MVFQGVHEVASQLAFLVAMGLGGPLRAIHVVNRNEGRFAGRRQAHILPLQVGIDLLAELGMPIKELQKTL